LDRVTQNLNRKLKAIALSVSGGQGSLALASAQRARSWMAKCQLSHESCRNFALKYGATRAIDPAKEFVHGLDADVFIYATGVIRAVYDGVKAVRPSGRVILVGMGDGDFLLPVGHIQSREIWVSGIFRYTNTWPTAIELLASGKVDLDSLVIHRFSLDQLEEALRAPKLPGAMKPVVLPDG